MATTVNPLPKWRPLSLPRNAQSDVQTPCSQVYPRARPRMSRVREQGTVSTGAQDVKCSALWGHPRNDYRPAGDPCKLYIR